MKNKPIGVFVYGTLKRGEKNHSLMKDAREILPAKMMGALYDLPYGYPAMTPEGETDVNGEVYIFNDIDKALSLLDRLEGYDKDDISNSLYLRTFTEATTQDGKALSVWVYIAGRKLKEKLKAIGKVCEDGNWGGRCLVK